MMFAIAKGFGMEEKVEQVLLEHSQGQGDVIVKFGDAEVPTPQALQLAVERSPLGEETPMEIVRQGKSMQLTYHVT